MGSQQPAISTAKLYQGALCTTSSKQGKFLPGNGLWAKGCSKRCASTVCKTESTRSTSRSCSSPGGMIYTYDQLCEHCQCPASVFPANVKEKRSSLPLTEEHKALLGTETPAQHCAVLPWVNNNLPQCTLYTLMVLPYPKSLVGDNGLCICC